MGVWCKKRRKKAFSERIDREKRVGCDTELRKIKHGPTAITVQRWGRHAQMNIQCSALLRPPRRLVLESRA